MKDKLNKYYSEFIENIDELIYLSILLKQIINKVDKEDDVLNLELDMMSISVSYKYDREKILRLKKELDNIIGEYGLNIESIESSYIEEMIDRIILKSSKNND
jgi:hypothetical protein